VESLAGLIPIHLHIRKLAERSTARLATLSNSHPLLSLFRREGDRQTGKHRQSIDRLPPRIGKKVRAPLTSAVMDLRRSFPEPFDADADEARPGYRLMDSHTGSIQFESLDSKDLGEQLAFVESWFAKANDSPGWVAVATDASVRPEHTWQAVSAARIWYGGAFRRKARRAAGRVTAPDAELYAIRLGVGLALAAPNVKNIVLFTDHLPSAEAAFDPSPHSGQEHSLDVCKNVREWLRGDPERSITFVKVLSSLEWDFHHRVHCYASDPSLKVAIGRRPHTTIGWLRKHHTSACIDEWTRLFATPEYTGRHFLKLTDKSKVAQPSYLAGGTWCSVFDEPVEFSWFCCGVLDHAPTGDFRRRFKFPGPYDCRCENGGNQTRDHIIHRCPRYQREIDDIVLDLTTVPGLAEFCRKNPSVFSFGDSPSGD